MSMNYDDSTRFTIGETNCIHRDTEKYWIPIVQGQPAEHREGQYLWLDDRPGFNKSVMQELDWMTSQPNGELFQQCVELRKRGRGAENQGEFKLNDAECKEKKCSICKMPLVQQYLLRGSHDFDHEYRLSLNVQSDEKRIVFEGKGLSWIKWHPLKQKTELWDMADGNKTIAYTFNQTPFGLLKTVNRMQRGDEKQNRWTFTNVSILATQVNIPAFLVLFQ